MTDLERLTARLRAFAEARRWERFHTPKNLAMALAAEVGEVVEHFQWLTPEESSRLAEDTEALDEVTDELADVGIYLLRLADVMGVDLAAAIDRKIDRNEERFPPGPARDRDSWR